VAEGANEVLKSFIALVGVRAPGMQFQELQESLRHPWGEWRKMWALGMDRANAVMRSPPVPLQSPQLNSHAHRLGRAIRKFNLEVDRALIRYREEILDRQYVQERLANVATELFASACVLSRWDAELQSSSSQSMRNGAGEDIPDLFLRGSFRRIDAALAE